MTRTARTKRTFLVAGGLLAVVGILAACGPTVGKPALRQAPNVAQVFDNSDPAVLVADGKTYLFGSTNNMRVPVRQITSYGGTAEASQTDWARNPRDAMPTRPAWMASTGDQRIWAPSVTKIGSNYIMYFAARNKATTTDPNNDRCIGRAGSKNPLGPYNPEATPAYCGLPPEGAVAGQPASNRFGRGAIDPEVFRSPDGKLWLAVALGRTKGNIATVALRSDGSVSGGPNATPSVLVSQGRPWHDGTDNSTLSGFTFLENPSMVYEPATKTYLLFYSAGAWNTAAYNTSFARCASPTGPCSEDTRGPFLKNGNGRTGIGGLTAFRDGGGSLRVAYASWKQGFEAPGSNPGGIYSRRTHFAPLRVTATADPANQAVSLG